MIKNNILFSNVIYMGKGIKISAAAYGIGGRGDKTDFSPNVSLEEGAL